MLLYLAPLLRLSFGSRARISLQYPKHRLITDCSLQTEERVVAMTRCSSGVVTGKARGYSFLRLILFRLKARMVTSHRPNINRFTELYDMPSGSIASHARKPRAVHASF
jgi:hypothetical protein